MRFPKETGRVVEDLSSDAPPNTPKSLYVITFEDDGRNLHAPPKPYGVFWSADGPTPVNNIAIELWPKLGSATGRDCEHNLDGKLTKPGECYDGFACFGYGQVALTVSVDKVEAASRIFMQLFDKGLIEEALVLRGIEMDERFMAAIEVIRTTMSWKIEPGALDALYDIFGYPEEEKK